MNKSQKSGLLLPVMISLILMACWSTGMKAQVVSPLQAGHYFPGVINVRDMTTPPPGMFFILYDTYMWSHHYVDRNGNRLDGIDLSQLDPRLPDLNVDMDILSFAATPVVEWASKFKILGATYLALVSLPGYSYSKARIFGEMGPGMIDTTLTTSSVSRTSGFGDLMLQPLGLAWTVSSFNLMLTYAFYAPTGRYATGGSDNTGLGYWTHQFQGFGYFFPVEDQSTALMLGLTFETNSRIMDTHVRPGNRLTLEWGVSQYLSERFELTVQGSGNWQTGNDSGEDVWWDPAVHDRKSTMLFSANYWVVKNKLYFALKYGFDFAIRQRFDNNLMLFNIIYNPGILTGKKKNL